MKRITALLFAAVLLIPSLVLAQNIKKGDTAIVPDWEWVDVKNARPVSSGNNEFGYGRSCGVKRGGIVTVVGIDGDRLLVRYQIAGTPFGTPCPSGVLFFIKKETFSKMTAEYHRVLKAEQDEKNLIERLLKK